MKITKQKLLAISASLNYLASNDTAAWYQVGRNLKRIEAPVKELEATKNTILEKFMQKDDKGEVLFLDEAKTKLDLGGDQKEADSLWVELQKEEVEVEFFQFSHSVLTGTKLNARAIESLIDTIIID